MPPPFAKSGIGSDDILLRLRGMSPRWPVVLPRKLKVGTIDSHRILEEDGWRPCIHESIAKSVATDEKIGVTASIGCAHADCNPDVGRTSRSMLTMLALRLRSTVGYCMTSWRLGRSPCQRTPRSSSSPEISSLTCTANHLLPFSLLAKEAGVEQHSASHPWRWMTRRDSSR